MYDVDLKGKSALVTGASRGIGRYIAEALHLAGAEVAITGRSKERLESAADDIGQKCLPIVCDQRDPNAVNKMREKVVKELGVPNILVNNAGIARFSMVADTSLEDWRDVLDTNLTGVFLVTKAFLPGMIERGSGDIFMISSMSGKKGDPGMAGYCASKFALQGFSQGLLYEVRKHNIRVMVLNPSSVNTSQDVGPTEGPGVHLHAADIAATVLHLAGLPRRTLVRDMDFWGTNP